MKLKSTTTSRLKIRPLQAADYAAWLEAYGNSLPKQSKYDRDPYPRKKCSKAKFRSTLKRYQRLAREDSTYVWGVFESSAVWKGFKKTASRRLTGVAAAPRLIGILDISIIKRGPLQVANLGYRVFNRYWRVGYGKEFVRAGISLGFKTLKINRLEAVIDPDNKASRRLAVSVGMLKEGLRKKYYYQNNRWADQIVYSAQREAWGFSKLRVKT